MSEPPPRRATTADAAALNALARAAYAIYLPVIGREPQPMATDWQTLFASQEIWIVDGPAGPIASLALEVAAGPRRDLERRRDARASAQGHGTPAIGIRRRAQPRAGAPRDQAVHQRQDGPQHRALSAPRLCRDASEKSFPIASSSI